VGTLLSCGGESGGWEAEVKEAEKGEVRRASAGRWALRGQVLGAGGQGKRAGAAEWEGGGGAAFEWSVAGG